MNDKYNENYIEGYSDELYHFGIKGQKWGIRRYQNEDGTLTVAGKARYGAPDKKLYTDSYGDFTEKTKRKYEKDVNAYSKKVRYGAKLIGKNGIRGVIQRAVAKELISDASVAIPYAIGAATGKVILSTVGGFGISLVSSAAPFVLAGALALPTINMGVKVSNIVTIKKEIDAIRTAEFAGYK